MCSVQFSRSVVIPWTAVRQASLSITNSWSLLKLTSIKSVMPSNRLILCRPLLLPSIFPSIRVFSNESVLHIRWPKYWSFSFNICPSNEYSGRISFRMDWVECVTLVQRDFADQVKDLDVGRLLWPLWVSLCSYECLYKRKTGSDERQRWKQRSE